MRHALLAAILALPLLADPHPSKCLEVQATRRGPGTWEMYAKNTCPTTIKQAAVLVKFFNPKWERVGVSGVVMHYIAPGEVVRREADAPAYLKGKFKYVGVRAITDDPLDALK